MIFETDQGASYKTPLEETFNFEVTPVVTEEPYHYAGGEDVHGEP